MSLWISRFNTSEKSWDDHACHSFSGKYRRIRFALFFPSLLAAGSLGQVCFYRNSHSIVNLFGSLLSIINKDFR
jgi:hypothetical protein